MCRQGCLIFLGMGFSVRWCVELELSIEYFGHGRRNGVRPGLHSKQRGRNHTRDSQLFRCVDDALSAFWCAITRTLLIVMSPTLNPSCSAFAVGCSPLKYFFHSKIDLSVQH